MQRPPWHRRRAAISECSGDDNPEHTVQQPAAQETSAPRLKKYGAPARGRGREPPPPHGGRYLFALTVEDLETGRTACLVLPRADLDGEEASATADELMLMLEQESLA
jgi:hypothetical protein